MIFKLVDMVGAGLFSVIGFAAFVYGKKESNFRVMITAALLMGYPFVVTQTVWIYAVGAALTASLFIFRD